jgi:hypothetical protein
MLQVFIFGTPLANPVSLPVHRKPYVKRPVPIYLFLSAAFIAGNNKKTDHGQ